MRHRNLLRIMLIVAFLSLLVYGVDSAHAQKSLCQGYVRDLETGLPVEGAEVIVMRRSYRWRIAHGWERFLHLETGGDGSFQFRADEGEILQVIAYKQDPSTPGYDYMPEVVSINPPEIGGKLDFSLRKAATLKMGGMGFFVETTDLPSTKFKLLDPESGEPILPVGIASSFGSGPNTINDYLGLSPEMVIVPANSPFLVQVGFSLTIEGGIFNDEFIIDDYRDASLEAGGYSELDLRRYTLPDSIDWVQSKLLEVKELLAKGEEEGFFLAVERSKLAEATRLLDDANTLYDGGYFARSFTSLREAYIELSNLEGWVTGLSREASRDISILVLYIAITSVIISNMVYEDWGKKALSSLIAYSILLPILFLLHPGSQLVSYYVFMRIGVVSIVFALGLGYFAPLMLDRLGSGASVTRMIAPIFSIAKRSLRRRCLRFFFTITSVLMLVASFIAFTSFTTGYGITHQQVPDVVPSVTGVMVRTPNPPPSRATAVFSGGVGVGGPSPLDEDFIDFFRAQEDVRTVSPKYESPPHHQYRENYSPYGWLGDAEIFGVMSISPCQEDDIHDLDSLILDGRYLDEGDDEMMIISDGLATEIGASVGDVLTLTTRDKTVELTLIGIIDGAALDDVIDLDGASLLPRKIIELERIEQEGPDIVIEGLVPCEAEEVIITSLESEPILSSMFLNRISLLLSEEVDSDEFARILAIDKGLRAWASTARGVYLSKIGGYFEGKGLPVVIPWIIVVLNVVVTMLNSYYERRGEMTIYSSIGMNPSHISGVFLAEATVIGVIGGSLGYLLGMGTYRLVYIVTPALQVRQKVSILWTLAALAVSLAAVIVGGLVALKSSTSITPSLRRKWRARGGKTPDELNIPLPIKIQNDELSAFKEHLLQELRRASGGIIMVTRMIIEKKENIDGEPVNIIEFIYKNKEGGGLSTIYSKNKISIEEDPKG
ncbi:MAG: FtsX-like permease family protein, partial [Candidatus Bathyarchaeia archaeon]